MLDLEEFKRLGEKMELLVELFDEMELYKVVVMRVIVLRIVLWSFYMVLDEECDRFFFVVGEFVISDYVVCIWYVKMRIKS